RNNSFSLFPKAPPVSRQAKPGGVFACLGPPVCLRSVEYVLYELNNRFAIDECEMYVLNRGDTRMAESARWTTVADRIRRQIERGELQPGAQITPEAELAEELELSRATVRRALQALTEEGLITGGKGKLGRRVRERPTL